MMESFSIAHLLVANQREGHREDYGNLPKVNIKKSGIHWELLKIW